MATLDLEFPVQVDDVDAWLLTEFNWRLSKNGYVVRNKTRKGPAAYLHRVIMAAGSGQLVDHVNRNKLDNRRVNLRFATKSLNAVNAKKKRGVSQYRGVAFAPDTNRKNPWVARSQNKTIGYFATEHAAALARDAHEFAKYGEFAVLNFPRE